MLMLVVKKKGMKQSEWVKHMPPWHWSYMLGSSGVDVSEKYTFGIQDWLHAEWGLTASYRIRVCDGTMLTDVKLK